MEKRKIFVVSGYGFSSVSKLIIGIASSWHFILAARFVDRLGKGIRTSARDSILLDNSSGENKGFIFGFHRAFDSAGAVLGPIAALILLNLMKENIRSVFFIAFIPSFIGVLLLIFLIKEKRRSNIKKNSNYKLGFDFYTLRSSLKNFNPSLKLFFIISILFSLGNSSDAFLILRTKDLGFTTTLTVAAYMLYNLSQTIFAAPAGQLADRVGARRVYAWGLLVFALVYLLFGIVKDPFWFWFIFPLYGIYIAATDGVSKAYLSEFISKEESGTYFGLYQTGIAVASFFASFIAGILWNFVNPNATFFYGALMSLLAFVVLMYGKAVRKI